MGEPPFAVGGGSWVVGGSWAVGRRSWVVGGGGSVAGVRWRWPGGWCAVVVGPGRPVCGGCRAWPPGIRAGAVGVRANAFRRACVTLRARASSCPYASARDRVSPMCHSSPPTWLGGVRLPRPGWAGLSPPTWLGGVRLPRPGWADAGDQMLLMLCFTVVLPGRLWAIKKGGRCDRPRLRYSTCAKALSAHISKRGSGHFHGYLPALGQTPRSASCA